MKKHNTTFFVHVDCLLDTRLALLNIMDPEVTFEILSDKSYFNRETDDWEKLTKGRIKNKDFKERYDARTKELLKNSKLSAFIAYLKDFIIDAEEIFTVDSTAGIPKIMLNMYPYNDLTEIEIIAFKEAIEISCSCTMTEVEVCYYNPYQLTPAKIKNDCEFFYIYNFEEWKNLHLESIGRKEMMGVYVTTPRLFIKEAPPDEYLEIDEGCKMTPWKAAEMCMLPFMNLNMIPVKYFSLFLP